VMPHPTASQVLVDRALSCPGISFKLSTTVEGMEKQGEEIVLRLREEGREGELAVGGVIVSVGLVPNTGYLKEQGILDESGWVITDEMMRTPLPGVFAAGDIRRSSPRQAVSAACDGAVASISAFKFLQEVRG